MYKQKRILALIPARSGSKRMPGKNIKLLSGKPLIAWSIKEAEGSKYIDRIIVSTDDKGIARVSRKYGADVPFLRPERFAGDDSKSIDVILHAIGWMRESKDRYDILVLLQPTSPFRTSDDIDKAIRLFFLKRAKAVISVCETECHPYWTNTLPNDGCMKVFLRPEARSKSRRDFPVFYRLNGAIYLFDRRYIETKKSFYGSRTYAYLMPPERSVDIDNEVDFKFARFLITERNRLKKNKKKKEM